MIDYCVLSACPLVGQVNATCGCPQNCFRPANQSCVELCDGCNCASPTMADYITGKCVQPDQCTGKFNQLALMNSACACINIILLLYVAS